MAADFSRTHVDPIKAEVRRRHQEAQGRMDNQVREQRVRADMGRAEEQFRREPSYTQGERRPAPNPADDRFSPDARKGRAEEQLRREQSQAPNRVDNRFKEEVRKRRIESQGRAGGPTREARYDMEIRRREFDAQRGRMQGGFDAEARQGR